MAKRKPIEMLPTMKVDADNNEELDLKFKACQGEIVNVFDVDTKHGQKTIATLISKKLSFNVFINNPSMINLCEVLGDDDVKWLGQKVELKLEKDEKYDQDMIVIHPVK